MLLGKHLRFNGITVVKGDKSWLRASERAGWCY